MLPDVNDLAATMMRAAGVEVPVEHAAARPGELQRSAVAIARAADRLDWRPEVPLSEGLRRTYEWIAGVSA